MTLLLHHEIFVGLQFILWGHWLFLFWTLYDPSHGFQSQGGSLTCTLTCLHAVNLRVTSQWPTPAFSTNKSVNCMTHGMCVQQACLLHIPHASSRGQAAVNLGHPVNKWACIALANSMGAPYFVLTYTLLKCSHIGSWHSTTALLW